MSDKRIAVAVTDEPVRSQVTICLEFVGEQPVQWREGDPLPDHTVAVIADAPASVSVEIPVIGLKGVPLGANVVDALELPLKLNALHTALHRATLYLRQHQADNIAGPSEELMFPGLVGGALSMIELRALMAKVAGKDVTVLIFGESGTGKEVVARSMHDASHRAVGPFVPVNCGAIPSELIESELFGHERGAFTGALSTKPGRFELADGGTLFLDEIGELPMPMQVKLLRVLQERCFERVGGSETLRANVRIVAATHRDLEQMIHDGEFREDLFYRLNVFPMRLPPLRDRPEDLGALIAAIGQSIEARGEANVRFDSEAMNALAAYRWPGNVRELSNLMERVTIAHPGEVISLQDLPRKLRGGSPALTRIDDADSKQSDEGLLNPESRPLLPVNGIDLKDYLNRLERSLIQQALDDTDSVVARAADRLHIRRTTLVEKMRKYGLQRNEIRT